MRFQKKKKKKSFPRFLCPTYLPLYLMFFYLPPSFLYLPITFFNPPIFPPSLSPTPHFDFVHCFGSRIDANIAHHLKPSQKSLGDPFITKAPLASPPPLFQVSPSLTTHCHVRVLVHFPTSCVFYHLIIQHSFLQNLKHF